ncbi:MAG: 3'-5' exonuclease [Porphyromonas sp.]|nr:3'-5' exonuclease [Porphyromonas sp.]
MSVIDVYWLLGILGAVALVLLALLFIPTNRGLKRARGTVRSGSNPPHQPDEAIRLLPIPKAPDTAVPKWCVIDLQTTGLDTDRDRIVEASWLLMDEAYREIRRSTKLIRQTEIGSPEAIAIHRRTLADLQQLGITEGEWLHSFVTEIPPGVTLVAHNLAFDREILRSTVERIAPEYTNLIDRFEGYCTMMAVKMEAKMEAKGIEEEGYISLRNLTRRHLGIPDPIFDALTPVSWRNVYFTRLCLQSLNK